VGGRSPSRSKEERIINKNEAEPQSGIEGGQKDVMCKGQVGVRKGV
jgi:hypothetical protein